MAYGFVVTGYIQYLNCFICMVNDKFLFLQAETLVDHIKFDHGYTAKSPAIVNVSVFLIFPLPVNLI